MKTNSLTVVCDLVFWYHLNNVSYGLEQYKRNNKYLLIRSKQCKHRTIGMRLYIKHTDQK